MNSYIGRSGIESVFEEYLRGIDGERQIDMDVNGGITEEYIVEEAVAGNNIILTIDSNIQKVAEDSLKDNIHNLIGGYNTFLQAVDEYKNITSSNKLSFEMKNVAKLYRNELDAIGINITDRGTLSVDDNLLVQTAESEDAYDLLSPLKNFSSSLYKKGEEISRDPLNYANKRLVAYKNPGKNFTSPYAVSSYSGLLFNYYC